MEFGLLGPLLVRCGETALPVPQGKQRTLLAVLLLDANRVVPADDIAESLWGPAPPPSAAVTVRNYVSRLRQALGGNRISFRQGGYVISVGEGELDVSRFANLLASARAAGRVGSWDKAAALAGEALGLWRGEPLADVESDALALRERPRLAELRLQAAEIRVEAGLWLGRHAEVLAEVQRLAADHPLREHLHALLMLALYRCGRQAEALTAYQQARAVLVGELGIEPGSELQQLQQQILAADPALDLPRHAGTADGAGRSTADGGDGLGGAELTGAARRLAAEVPRQLPAVVSGFAGRAAELAALTQILDGADAGTPGTVVISAIGGTAGVGKTALALHWAHQVAGRFPGGQLYVNLRGFGPSGVPMTAAEAIRGFLGALGVPPDRIPSQPQARAGLYRSLLASRSMLIVLDNARDEQQVRPLLPASASSLVIVTSRNQLAGLAAADHARLLTLDVLSQDEAVHLLTARIGAGRAGAEPAAADQIAALCGRLPLALAVAAARVQARPDFPLAVLAAKLQDRAGLLDALDVGDPAASVRAVFSWSYRQLSAAAARMFRLLGLHLGPDISVPAAASLAAVDEPEARRLLAELARTHLIAEHLPGRYAMHDLLCAYAADQARHTESDTDRREATGRALDHYLHTAAHAAHLLNPLMEPVVLAPPRPGAAPEQPADRRQALAWFEAEHQVVLGALALTAESGLDSHAWQLPWAMANFLQACGHWQDWAAAQRTALAAATRLGDTAGQALSSRLLANACSDLGDHDQARGYYAGSLTLYQRLGNRLGQARIQHSLGVLAGRQGRYADALGHAERALRLYQAIGDKTNEADALNAVGWCHGLLGDYQQARAFCRQALSLCAETGYRRLEGDAWDSLGYAEHHLGNLAEAAACYQRALSLYREAGDRFNEAETLTRLGDTRQAVGELAQAREAWQQALTILEDLQHPDADQIRAKLASTKHHTSPSPSA